MTLALIFSVSLGVLIAALWAIGAREQCFAISKGSGPHWFIAIRGQPGALKPHVSERWRSRADFGLIGVPPEDAYWRHFIIASGGDPARLPIDLGTAEDAYIARISLRRPPALLFGVLKTLVGLRILTKPEGPIVQDAQTLSFRGDVMPSAASIARLLAQPQNYAPAMVNFLAYHKDAQYRTSAPGISGRRAYLRYGVVAMRTVYRTGGHLLFTGRVLDVLREASAGPGVGRWDDVAAMRYPNPPAILSMEHAPDYHAALDDRDAGLERTIVIATTPGI
ncbi:DUF1330 domain-containing protein [Candidatus Viadribacter manganicus]|uniref:DUF1330 domain-containing protein n=1 Tax=Candidatus Viadribacter manganicus TaxID=1759059 RepID=A0A1B1AHL3_9PROT|nr:hypothetical protein [Candidatus Viadribacter manganicus]ANP46031.1 hypothetical protein ATE48_08915 [Candidatus Viadribacter manganicus]